jgi:hypothetical protein
MSEGALEAAIRERARDFEVGALVRLLRAKFPELPIRFRSHRSLGPRPTPVHEVVFEAASVIVTLNLGLFSSTTSLPSYFQEWLDGPQPVPGLEGILGVLDDRLLRDRSDGAVVSMSPRLLPRARAVRRNLLQLARPASEGTLHWLFAKLFPELGVSVARAGVHRSLFAGEPRLGQARLGHTAMGGEADVLTPGYDVFLATGESSTWRGEPWPHEARRRLTAGVFPALAETAVHLRILLFDFEGSMRLSLIRASTFGFDPLTRAASPHVIVLHEGKIDRAFADAGDAASPA